MAVFISVMNQRPKQTVITEVALDKGMGESFVEKDWFVIQVIAAIATIEHEGFEVIFAGGTALSKAHKLLQRFSEDVDFRVLVSEPSLNRKALSGFRHVVVESLRKCRFTIADTQIQARNSNRFFSIDLDYETYFSRADALRPHIQIELTASNTQLPPIYLPVSSFVNELTNQPPEVARIGCIDPVESATDKLSAIAWRIPDRVRGGQYDDPALVRHIHDLAILKDLALVHADFPGLVATSMREDNKRAKNDPSFSGLPVNEKFQRMLDILVMDREYAQEYDRFVKGVSYATEGNVPDFAKAIEAIRLLIKAVSPMR